MLKLKSVSMTKSICVLFRKMITTNYAIPTHIGLQISHESRIPIFFSKCIFNMFLRLILRPRDTHLTLPISATQGDLPGQQRRMSIYSMGIDLLWLISATQGDH